LAHDDFHKPRRLQLCDNGNTHGAVDGAWWPRSSELTLELPDLVVVLGRLIGPIQRVIYDPAIWPLTVPSRIVQGTNVTSIDPYRLVEADTIYLIGTHSRRAVLFVVPPSTPQFAVDMVLRTVGGAARPVTAVMLRRLAGQSGRTALA
jgi:hypothetical protein